MKENFNLRTCATETISAVVNNEQQVAQLEHNSDLKIPPERIRYIAAPVEAKDEEEMILVQSEDEEEQRELAKYADVKLPDESQPIRSSNGCS